MGKGLRRCAEHDIEQETRQDTSGGTVEHDIAGPQPKEEEPVVKSASV